MSYDTIGDAIPTKAVLLCASFPLPVKVYISPGLAGRRTYPPLHPHLREEEEGVTLLAAGKPRHHLPYFALRATETSLSRNANERMRAKGRAKKEGKKRGQTSDLNCRRDTVRATNEFRRKIRAAIRVTHGPLNALMTAENAPSWNTCVPILRAVVVAVERDRGRDKHTDGTSWLVSPWPAVSLFRPSFHTPSVTSSLATGASTRASIPLRSARTPLKCPWREQCISSER